MGGRFPPHYIKRNENKTRDVQKYLKRGQDER